MTMCSIGGNEGVSTHMVCSGVYECMDAGDEGHTCATMMG